ncbi:hypothetical protein ACJMK2_037108 [Sinanodonta woodiana]|uniref:Pyrroline-5-carboxylate reductase catalytic N-terminal domain-containing protein n=1 Tax=Sinanodonta woodiana TaxID=1069815 RepID=A0ABD3WJ89_SINWO
MALATRLQKASAEQVPVDITINLQTLQFQSALTEEEKELQFLRARSHALTVFACAQATYLVSILNEARQTRTRIKMQNKPSTRILSDRDSLDSVKVGILGCGRLGSQLANCFMTFGNINPKDIIISTRRPEILENLINKGVECIHDNIKLVTRSHIVFLCVLPSQIPAVAEEVKMHIPQTLFLYSFASSCPTKKLIQMFGTSNIIRPGFVCSEENKNSEWDYSLNVSMALEHKEVVLKTCSLAPKTDCVVSVPEKLAELIIFMLTNMCTHLNMSRQETLDMIHKVIFPTAKTDLLQQQEFVKMTSTVESETFPLFNLLKILDKNTAVLKKLKHSPTLRQAFVDKYCHIFEEYVQHKIYGDLYQLKH